MNIVQRFYDDLADCYDKLFLDWERELREQGVILDELFKKFGFDRSKKILDCACGIGTQSIGLALLGYDVTASDISDEEIKQAKKRAIKDGVDIKFEIADFRELSKTFREKFDIVICMDNALPHMLTKGELDRAVKSITERVDDGGVFVASIRDYDEILQKKPTYSPPYIHESDQGKRVSFQTWAWEGDIYKFTQYVIEDEGVLKTHKFDCSYRAIKRAELTDLLLKNGFKRVEWAFASDTGFYQPVVVALK